jgi:hypothetical protein
MKPIWSRKKDTKSSYRCTCLVIDSRVDWSLLEPNILVEVRANRVGDVNAMLCLGNSKMLPEDKDSIQLFLLEKLKRS